MVPWCPCFGSSTVLLFFTCTLALAASSEAGRKLWRNMLSRLRVTTTEYGGMKAFAISRRQMSLERIVALFKRGDSVPNCNCAVQKLLELQDELKVIKCVILPYSSKFSRYKIFVNGAKLLKFAKNIFVTT